MHTNPDTSEKANNYDLLVTFTIVVVVTVAVAASTWSVVKAIRAPLPEDLPVSHDVKASVITPEPEPLAVSKTILQPDSAPSSLAGTDEFITDFTLIQQREQGARETATALRQQAQEDPENAPSDDFIKAVERGEVTIH